VRHWCATLLPQETYNYYYLPFCKHKPNGKDEHAWGGLGEVLQGNELINSQLDVQFKGV
jgi:transmembrane 9 superfamily protein 3